MLNDKKRFSKFLNALIKIEKAINDSIGNKKVSSHNETLFDETEFVPRFPAKYFSYKEALDSYLFSSTENNIEFYEKIASFFKGAVRPESSNFLLNIHPNPDVEATAAACLALYHNIDGLMDEYSGEALLVEQIIARELGRWIGWINACGTATAGGKMTNLHALRTSLAQISPDYFRKGIPHKTIIIASEGSHYSLKYVARDIGLGCDNCWLIPMNENFSMDYSILDLTLRKAWDNNYIVAAIICCGGSTIDFHCDNLLDIYNTVVLTIKNYPSAKFPYFHVDSVIGWQYLAFRNLLNDDFDKFNLSYEIKERILEVNKRLQGIEFFDSFAVDFHKNGLCPISSSFFISKNDSFMQTLSFEKEVEMFSNMYLGQHRPYRYTIENSRSMQGVAAAWGIMTKFGRHGIAKYLIELHKARDNFEKALKKRKLFLLKKRNSLGWEVVCNIKNEKQNEKNIRDFVDYCNDLSYKGHSNPLLGYVLDKQEYEILLYPMRFYSIKEATAVVENIEKLWFEFINSDIKKKKLIMYVQNEPIR
jgi:glutamate/tyrosine decarboxylase-like PLP-dependent enzyme